MLDLPPEPIPVQDEQVLVPVTAQCIENAARVYRIHPDLIYATLIVEGGTVGEISKPNSDGSYDIGPAQINSIHLAEMATFDITEVEIKSDGCLNIHWQARHLAKRIRQAGEVDNLNDYLYAIARYHSKNKDVAKNYVDKLLNAFSLLYNQKVTD